MSVASCPGSCGELIQGWILGGEKLVSCPIDWYSTVEVRDGAPLPNERPLTRAMIRALLAHFGYPQEINETLRIEVHSTLPIAKGMASSTADIAATAVAAAHHLGHSLDETSLAALCVVLEPTDSTLFRQLTLFDHHHAGTQIACAPAPHFDLLVLESPVILRTEDYHRLPREAALKAHAGELELAWGKVQNACMQQDASLLGEAATLSAIASQALLPKPGFDALMALVESCGLYGLNVAHSGSVVGLMLDRHRHDVEYLTWALTQKKLTDHWPKQHLLSAVAGGVQLST
ncbi:GHMP kinase [Kluyvera genomosp. 1]|uniref:GHMP family kinase ATP-binding protein n=1 Tax=Kluyvera genomosp. 1 TaxID=2774053 RepID=UPI000689F1FE|nr:GHMP kinase [Kluyvera genomosp. 1]